MKKAISILLIFAFLIGNTSAIVAYTPAWPVRTATEPGEGVESPPLYVPEDDNDEAPLRMAYDSDTPHMLSGELLDAHTT